MQSCNICRLEIVARGLGELNKSVVYVGGAVAELYVTDPAKTDIRETMDIDCVVELSSYVEQIELEKKLREKGFENDTSTNAPLCRWVYKGEIVDIMPDDDKIMGFTNKWYHEALLTKQQYILANGIEINLFSLPYYVATKLEAVKGRGGDDWRSSHDFEDIIYILNYCPNFVCLLNMANENLRRYFKEEFTKINTKEKSEILR